jgi:hypothetical protein
VAGLTAGALWALLAPDTAAPQQPTIQGWVRALITPMLLTAAVAVAVGLLVLLVWRAVTGRFAWRAIPVGLIAAVLGAGLGGAIQTKVDRNYTALTQPRTPARPGWPTTFEEMQAALWLDAHAGNDDVIATNVHCQPIIQVRSCDARSFWVTGLAGRRTLVESWAYSDQTVAANGTNGQRYMLQPAPYPDRYALNQRVFAHGDPADVARLRTEFHVRWLYADARALGGASPALAQVATLRYRAGTVSIYQL